MGCDGGTIPTRGELVKTKKKPEQLSKETELSIKWQHCALSQEPLRQPVVACRLGQLYNKEALIEFLLTRSKSSSEERLDHIKGLKDFKELRLTPNPAFHEESDTKYGAGATGERMNTARFICPITGLEMNGRFRFSYLATCGCTFSERALTEVKEAGSAGCLQCGRMFSRDEVVPINGDMEEVERLKERLEAERNSKASKKGKRTKSSVSEETDAACSDNPANKKQKQECTGGNDKSSTGSPNGDKHNTDEVEQGGAVKDSKSEKLWDSDRNGVIDSKSKNRDSGKTRDNKSGDSNRNWSSKNDYVGKSNDNDKGKRLMKISSNSDGKKVKSIQEDGNATEAFKSLFNTHPTALKQGKAHWVTYNPQYN